MGCVEGEPPGAREVLPEVLLVQRASVELLRVFEIETKLISISCLEISSALNLGGKVRRRIAPAAFAARSVSSSLAFPKPLDQFSETCDSLSFFRVGCFSTQHISNDTHPVAPSEAPRVIVAAPGFLGSTFYLF